MKKYKSIDLMVQDIVDGKIPRESFSPGYAASVLGITRQAVNHRIHKSKTLEAWGSEGCVLISLRSILECYNKKRSVPVTQEDFLNDHSI